MKKQIITLVLITNVLIGYAQIKKPNVVIFFVDDLGWADVGYRNPIFHTPNIDQLKKDGMEFTRAYISTPTCSPSRASLLTGKEPIRFQMPRHITNEDPNNTTEEFNQWPKDPVHMPSRNWLPLKEITYAERLKEYGYYNVFVGKWHLGGKAFYPIKQGFDEQIGVTPFGHAKSFYPPFFPAYSPFQDAQKSDYLTDILTDKTQEFIKNYKKDQPFELSLYYYNVHSPQIGPKDLVKKYEAEGLKGDYAQYAAKITAVDQSIGKVMQTIKEKGIADNTIIIFTSDQGGFFTNAPLSGGKIGGNTLGEGGARVPMIIYYPGVTKANTVTNTPIQTLDIYPTLVNIVSGKKCRDKQVNGVSLMPLLKGGNIKPRNLYFFRSYEDQYAAVIAGDWKLIKYHSGLYHLFNIKNDISEKTDLYSPTNPEAIKLKKALSKWENEVVVKH